MKKTRINRISKKKQAIIRQENILRDKMLEHQLDTVGYIYCMLCGKKPDWRGLEKNHTKDRKLFALSCHECQEWPSPDGRHRYLDAVLPNED